jgi:hypothetical protein
MGTAVLACKVKAVVEMKAIHAKEDSGVEERSPAKWRQSHAKCDWEEPRKSSKLGIKERLRYYANATRTLAFLASQ